MCIFSIFGNALNFMKGPIENPNISLIYNSHGFLCFWNFDVIFPRARVCLDRNESRWRQHHGRPLKAENRKFNGIYSCIEHTLHTRWKARRSAEKRPGIISGIFFHREFQFTTRLASAKLLIKNINVAICVPLLHTHRIKDVAKYDISKLGQNILKKKWKRHVDIM